MRQYKKYDESNTGRFNWQINVDRENSNLPSVTATLEPTAATAKQKLSKARATILPSQDTDTSKLLTADPLGLWKAETLSYSPRFRKDFVPTPRIEHCIIPESYETIDLAAFLDKITWEIIHHHDTDSAKLHILLSSYAFHQPNPWQDEFKLSAATLVEELGWEKSKKFDHGDQLNRVAHYAWLLGNVTMKIIHNEGQKNSGTDYSHLWNISLLRQHGDSNHEGIVTNPKDVSITVKPGCWSEHFINKDIVYRSGWTSQILLDLDSQRDALAMIFGVYSLINSRSPERDRNLYNIAELIRNTIPELYIMRGFRSVDAADNFRQRLYKAFDKLIAIGWRVEDLKFTDDWEILFNSTVRLEPPEAVPEAPRENDEPVTRIKPKFTVTKELVKKYRLFKGWTQKEMSEFLGISQELVSKIEIGTRAINAKVEARMRIAVEEQKQISKEKKAELARKAAEKEEALAKAAAAGILKVLR